MTTNESGRGPDFIRAIVAEDMASGKFGGRVVTRFPPEPNGYLHIGHAKAICLDFGLATDFGGRCHLRFDDTNPTKEETEYVDNIKADVRWLGFDWGEHLHFASDYFEQLYTWAVQLIEAGKAYVDDRSADQMREYRGTLTEPGRDSPARTRTVAENLDLFARMRAGEFADGARTLRAKIDMASPNLNMRDPAMYRIRAAEHHRTGDAWRIYPMYDWAHGQSDSIEQITHSFCTLEYTDHRPLYDWFLDALGIYHPQQIEFARLNLSHTVVSKRKLLQLVNEGIVAGWDDPRMPTLSGLRRKGYTPQSIRDFCDRVGVARNQNLISMALLEHCIRDDLNRRAARVMAVLRPLKLIIDNFPAGRSEQLRRLTTRKTPRWAPGRCLSRASSGSSRKTSARTRRPSISGSCRAARCACGMATSSSARAWTTTRPAAQSLPYTARTTPRRAPARRMAARSRVPSTGSRPRPRCPPWCGCTSRCS